MGRSRHLLGVRRRTSRGPQRNKAECTRLVAQHERALEEAVDEVRKAAEVQLEKVRGQFARRIEQLGRHAEISLARKIRRDALSQDDSPPYTLDQ